MKTVLIKFEINPLEFEGAEDNAVDTSLIVRDMIRGIADWPSESERR